MAAPTLRPDLPYAERLAGMAEAARRRGQIHCADRLLLLAWTALDDAGHSDAGPDGDDPVPRAIRTLPPQV